MPFFAIAVILTMYNWLLFKDNGETFYELPRFTQNFLNKEKRKLAFELRLF